MQIKTCTDTDRMLPMDRFIVLHFIRCTLSTHPLQSFYISIRSSTEVMISWRRYLMFTKCLCQWPDAIVDRATQSSINWVMHHVIVGSSRSILRSHVCWKWNKLLDTNQSEILHSAKWDSMLIMHMHQVNDCIKIIVSIIVSLNQVNDCIKIIVSKIMSYWIKNNGHRLIRVWTGV